MTVATVRVKRLQGAPCAPRIFRLQTGFGAHGAPYECGPVGIEFNRHCNNLTVNHAGYFFDRGQATGHTFEPVIKQGLVMGDFHVMFEFVA